MKHYSNNIIAVEKPIPPNPPPALPLREGIEKSQATRPLRADPPSPPPTPKTDR
jgi:hypothetical protein